MANPSVVEKTHRDRAIPAELTLAQEIVGIVSDADFDTAITAIDIARLLVKNACLLDAVPDRLHLGSDVVKS